MSIERRWPQGVYVRELPTVEGKIYTQVIESQQQRRIHVAGTLPFNQKQEMSGDMALQTSACSRTSGCHSRSSAPRPPTSCAPRLMPPIWASYLEHGQPKWVEFFACNPPTSTAVGVTELADPRALVEIEAYAEID